MNYQIESNGQVLVEQEPGTWVHFDMQYHIKAEVVNGAIKASIYDYLNKPLTTKNMPITFTVNGIETTVTPVQGVATLPITEPVGYSAINAPNVRGTILGESPIPKTPEQLAIEHLNSKLALMQTAIDDLILGGVV